MNQEYNEWFYSLDPGLRNKLSIKYRGTYAYGIFKDEVYKEIYLKEYEHSPIWYKMEYEAMKRLEWFLNGYFIHCLGNSFSKITTERICEIYNVKLNYFRPWIMKTK